MYCYTRLAKMIRDTEGLEGQILINLYPIHGLGTATNYQGYLDVFQEYYHPSLYSVDVYPIMQWNPLVVRADKFSGFKEMKAGELLQVHERFYRTLEMISAQSRKHNRPFWYFLISGELFNIKSSYYPVQKEEYMRYSAFTALAYGAEALIYWRFLENVDDRNNLLLTPGENKGNEMKYMNESFMRHPLNADRTRSPIWYYVRRINREIKRYEPIFLNTEVQNVFHTGLEELAQYAMSRYSGKSEYVKHGPAPWLEDLVEPERPTAEVWGLKPLETTSVPGIHSIESLDKGLGVIISHQSCMSGFKSAESGHNQGQKGVVAMPLPGEEYYMIVNHDSINAQKIKINFKPGYIIEELTPLKSGEDNENSPINTSDKNGCALSIERLLSPGGYLIFQRVR
ncbi:MAG: hypothetical protein K2G67_06320 [Muribaculaceae bacterium]|nr:hypothetical protein [Muribaculaceae bacterium]